eukprot:CAMPEP_0204530224 /NCGR_PEP_ID=MMETSP0661-20131031/10500_1 /ASSEMBLY_ACC=CAM_ASM_000606 /TAXON_ID=109239 /ORGANISM="Alexandrium margalefi, Strain AMGDE01CS-322" /LENGTH=678 /DNA_ID=CAMNT_0051536301 /DNA_START=59 /DNA_END=2095 /DNA_ORIENTATION=+
MTGESDFVAESIPISTLAVVLLLAPAAVLWAIVEVMHRTKGNRFGDTVLELLRCSTVLAIVLFLCFICEHAFYAEKAEKFYCPAMYWGCFGVVLLIAFFTIRKCPSDEFMNREQTEEWKGWMQFLFIQYHYWKMETAYKDIRIYITCYLWMTGFGNFSFFYAKEDFSLLRVLQMIWRMNFFVFFLCLTMDNAYIVYYICPLHTAFFCVSYLTMAIWSSANHSQYGPILKLTVCACLLYIFYDAVPQVFHPIFQWLGTQSTHAPIGGHGVEWEWYFRTFLDHYSTLFGMVFALNMPFLAAWFKRVESLPAFQEWGVKLSMLAAMAVMFGFWAHYVYSQDKMGYNAIHSYYGVVPLLSYLLLRNISKTLRGYYLHGLHWFGTITLECYLLQYHIWLSGNAAKLLNVVPGQWFLTFVLASILHLVCSQSIFNITNRLRNIFLPNDIGLALRNIVSLLAAVLICYAIAYRFIINGAAANHLIWVIAIIASLELCFMCMVSSNKVPEVLASKLQGGSKVGPLHLLYFAAFLAGLVVLNALLRSDRFRRKQILHADPVGHMGPHAAMFSREVDDSGHISALFSGYDFQESFELGRLYGFVVGSLAQKWHGLVALLASVLCLVVGDSYFGLARLFLFLWAPQGSKSIPYEESHGPLLAKLGKRAKPADAEAGGEATERTPLTARK